MRWTRNLHIYLGVVIAIMLLLVTVSGVLLIHKKALGLNQIMVSLPGYQAPADSEILDVLLLSNGETIAATKQGVFKKKGDHWQSVLNTSSRKLYMGEYAIYACAKNGLYESRDDGVTWQKIYAGREVMVLQFYGEDLVLATAEGVFRRGLQHSGNWQLIQSYPVKLPEIRAMEVNGNTVVTAAKEGVFVSQGQSAANLETIIAKDNNTAKVDLQKVIKDLHTGEFFGGYFYMVMDIMSGSIAVVTLTGVYLWYQSWRGRKKRKQKR